MRRLTQSLVRATFALILTTLSLPTATADAPPRSPTPNPKPESGLASWFRTRRALAAAHRKFPLGARVRVRARNGKSIVVTITDRGPFVKGRVIDLSSDAFRKLASLGTGLLRVTVERVR